MSTDITVRGTFSAFEAPERGTVHASLAFEGAAMQPVYDRVAAILESVRSTIVPLHNPDDGPVTWWSADQLRTWSNRPWNSDGVQLPFVHHASVKLDVKFSDFAALSRWVAQHTVDTDGFSVSQVEWALTERRRDELRKHARTEAVRDAVTRAQHYANALELGPIRPIAIADAGMLEANLRPEVVSNASYMRAMAAPAGAGGAPQVQLAPEDIEISAAVDARFVVADI